jgi:hypothetical protein
MRIAFPRISDDSVLMSEPRSSKTHDDAKSARIIAAAGTGFLSFKLSDVHEATALSLV